MPYQSWWYITQKWFWWEEQTKAFKALKEALPHKAVLAYFHSDALTFVVTDASPIGLGNILLQDQGTGQHQSIAYISHSLLPTERRYSQIERKVLGCVWTMERLHNYLFGVKFTLLMDNKPLSIMFDPHSSKVLPPRIQHGDYINMIFDFSHILGNGKTANSLLHLPSKRNDHLDSGFLCEDHIWFVCTWSSDLQAVTLSEMKSETSKDATLNKLLTEIQSLRWSYNQQLQVYSGIKEELSVFEGLILQGNPILVPQLLRRQILKLAHEMHQGIVKTKQFLWASFFWPSMDKAIKDTIKCCSVCVLSQPLNKCTPLQTRPLQMYFMAHGSKEPWISLDHPQTSTTILRTQKYVSSRKDFTVIWNTRSH